MVAKVRPLSVNNALPEDADSPTVPLVPGGTEILSSKPLPSFSHWTSASALVTLPLVLNTVIGVLN